MRWNQAASNALRTTIYEPIVDGKLIDHKQLAALAWLNKKASTSSSSTSGSSNGSQRRSARLAAIAAANVAAAGGSNGGGDVPLRGARLVGMAACFFASGAIHELIFW